MITKHSHSTVYVADQDRAKAFYTEKLGLEVREDVRMGNFRWLAVGPKTQPDHHIVLMLIGSGPTMTPAQTDALRDLVKTGAIGGGVFSTDDCKRDYEDFKAKGVEFSREPKEMPYGVEAVFKDDSGNFWSLTQRR
jgi:catechol 2,3-dioxygenase-like lactoylglutathione lyase family enzyme